MYPLFDSMCYFYRSPFGAVEEGTKVHFQILVPSELRCSKAQLAIKYDYDADWNFVNMLWQIGFDNTTGLWVCDFTPEQEGLYWYSFKINTAEGQRFIVPSDDPKEKSQLSRSPWRSWQLTCYKKDFKTPKWPVGGVMYQIFPDRFCYSGEPKNITRTDLTINENWYSQPKWWPNEHGEITNNDFFRGDLKGITQKLPYLSELGVTCIYLNPIFEAYSNHRYDTGDYSKIDPMLGTEEDFEELCQEAKKLGIHIINDGVFSHTGSDSIYFNRNGKYGDGGAFRDRNSPYFSWYRFSNWPHNYSSWWGFYTLPEVNENDPAFKEYINGENGIIRKWMKKGSSGWRIDVADELPDNFIKDIRDNIKSYDPDAFLIGEVWEDASNKESYGSRRKFLFGEELDSVMNYVFRNAIIDYIKGADALVIMNSIMTVVENYPKPVLNVLMNLLSTHDTERAITVLAGEPLNGRDRNWQAHKLLSHEEYVKGIKLMKIASGIQYTLPGFPCVYYGDETGMQGYKDPFNRQCFPWDYENRELIDWYKGLGKMRKVCTALWDGDIHNAFSNGNFLSYIRHDENTGLFCGFNTGETEIAIDCPPGYASGTPLMGTRMENGKLYIPPLSSAFIMI